MIRSVVAIAHTLVPTYVLFIFVLLLQTANAKTTKFGLEFWSVSISDGRAKA